MRVLLSCYGFSPYRGSEAAVGWNIAKELAKLCEVTAICGDVEEKQDVKSDLERWWREGGNIPNLTIEYVGPNRLISLVDKIHNLPCCWGLYYLAYNLWQRAAYRRAKELIRGRHFDVVHHLNMIGFREPGYMWKLPIPFCWGPVGGNVNEPIAYSSIYSLSGKVNVLLRNVINWVQKRVLMRPRLAARRAKKIWAVTDADEKTIRTIWGRDCERMIETAAMPSGEAVVRRYDSGETLRIVWSGTHTYGKALPILILALARLGIRKEEMGNRVNVYLMGKGVETEKWRKLTEREGVAGCFRWMGYLPHNEALRIMNRAHALVFTSVKEGTPHVVLEALSLGLPVICHDACGMGTVVNDTCGIKVPMRTPEESVAGFAQAIDDIISGRVKLDALSKGALNRAWELTWEEKAKKISVAYQEIINHE